MTTAPKKQAPASPAVGGRPDREVFVVVTYDIPNDRRRLKVMKTLEGYGDRVQYSVFECLITNATYGQLRQRLGKLISAKGAKQHSPGQARNERSPGYGRD